MINKIFLDEKNILEISRNMEKMKIIKLDNFIDNYSEIEGRICKLKFIKKRIPDKFSYSEAKSSFLKNMFNCSEFIEYISGIAGIRFKRAEIKILRFGHKDYTLMHDSLRSEDGFHFVLFFCDGWGAEWGGNKVILKNGQNFVLTPSRNSFIFFKLDRGNMEFFQYIRYFAGKREFFALEGSLK